MAAFNSKKEAKARSRAQKSKAYAVEISEKIVPQVLSQIESEGGFIPIPGPALDMVTNQIESKLLSYDKKILTERDRHTLAANIHRDRAILHSKARRMITSYSAVTKQVDVFRGSNSRLPEELFSYSSNPITRKNVELRRFSFPKLFYGANDPFEYLKEYSTISNWEDSITSWALTSGLRNPRPCEIYTDVIANPEFWTSVMLMSYTAMAYAGEDWLLACVDLLDRVYFYPDGNFISGVLNQLPSKMKKGNPDYSFPIEFWGRIYFIPISFIEKYYDRLVSDPNRFIVLCCAIIEFDHVSDEEIIAFIDSPIAEVISPLKGKVLSISDVAHLKAFTEISGKCVCVPKCPTFMHPRENARYSVLAAKQGKIALQYLNKKEYCVLGREYGPYSLTKEMAFKLTRVFNDAERERVKRHFRPLDIQRLSVYGDPDSVGIFSMREFESMIHTGGMQTYSTRSRMVIQAQGNPDLQSRMLKRRQLLCTQLEGYLTYVLEWPPEKIKMVFPDDEHNIFANDDRYDGETVSMGGSDFFNASLGERSILSSGTRSHYASITPDNASEANLLGINEEDLQFTRLDLQLDEYTSDIRFWGRNLVLKKGIG